MFSTPTKQSDQLSSTSLLPSFYLVSLPLSILEMLQIKTPLVFSQGDHNLLEINTQVRHKFLQSSAGVYYGCLQASSVGGWVVKITLPSSPLRWISSLSASCMSLICQVLQATRICAVEFLGVVRFCLQDSHVGAGHNFNAFPPEIRHLGDKKNTNVQEGIF